MDVACTNNPAGRLFLIMDRARQQGGDNPAGDVWQIVLGAASFPETLHALSLVAAMPNEIRREVEAIKAQVPIDMMLRPLPSIELALAEHFRVGWSHVTQHLKPEVMNDLEHTAEWLRPHVTTALITEDDINRLMIQVEELRHDLGEADIDPDLRALLVRHIDHMLAALRDVQWRGADALLDVGEAAFGAVVLEVHFHGDDEKRRPWSKRLGAIATAFILTCGTVKSGVELEQSLQKALTPPSAHAPATGDTPPPIVVIEEEPRSTTPTHEG